MLCGGWELIAWGDWGLMGINITKCSMYNVQSSLPLPIMLYFLDPDYRKDAPLNKDGTTMPHCCRCFKPFKSKGNFLSVTVNYDNLTVQLDPIGKELIGIDCWKIITTK